MTDIILTVFITSLFCTGLSLISREGNLLHFLRLPFEGLNVTLEAAQVYRHWLIPFVKFAIFISKPLIMCNTCMASVWGIIIYISLNGVPAIPHDWLLMVIGCICSAFLNTLFINIIEKLES